MKTVLLHGLGQTAQDWKEVVQQLSISDVDCPELFSSTEDEISYSQILGDLEQRYSEEKEPLRIWGEIKDGVIVPATSPVITCQCIRVPVLNGHTAAVFVKFRKKPTKEQLIEKLENFKGLPQELNLPSAPKQFIRYMTEDNRPQVTLDVNYENGMGINVGRLREDSIYDWKFVGLSHNTVRGAAGGAVLCAETLVAKKFIAAK